MPTERLALDYTAEAFTSGTVANATATATAPAVVGKTWFTTRILLTGSGPTTASALDLTVTGAQNGTLHFTVTPLAGILLAAFANGIESIVFDEAIAASGQNVAVSAILPALGSGSTNATVTLVGFYA